MVEGDARECVGGHEVICSLFPRLSSPHAGHQPLRMVHTVPSAAAPEEAGEQRALKLGVVLSGGQAPGALPGRGMGRQAARVACVRAGDGGCSSAAAPCRDETRWSHVPALPRLATSPGTWPLSAAQAGTTSSSACTTTCSAGARAARCWGSWAGRGA